MVNTTKMSAYIFRLFCFLCTNTPVQKRLEVSYRCRKNVILLYLSFPTPFCPICAFISTHTFTHIISVYIHIYMEAIFIPGAFFLSYTEYTEYVILRIQVSNIHISQAKIYENSQLVWRRFTLHPPTIYCRDVSQYKKSFNSIYRLLCTQVHSQTSIFIYLYVSTCIYIQRIDVSQMFIL